MDEASPSTSSSTKTVTTTTKAAAGTVSTNNLHPQQHKDGGQQSTAEQEGAEATGEGNADGGTGGGGTSTSSLKLSTATTAATAEAATTNIITGVSTVTSTATAANSDGPAAEKSEGKAPLSVDTRAEADAPPIAAKLSGTERKIDLDDSNSLMEATLFRLTAGLSKHELRTVVEEAEAVEELLRHEIQVLEQALLVQKGGSVGKSGDGAKNTDKDMGESATTTTTTAANEEKEPEGRKKGEKPMSGAVESADGGDIGGDPTELQVLLDTCPFTPLDGYWTVSALLGRLRGRDMSIPPSPMPQPPNPPSGGGDAAALSSSASAGDEARGASSGGQNEARMLLDLEDHPNYTAVHGNPAALLALHKRLASHRSSSVFKKAVKLEDAPGYDTRILFPIDLSLVRKQILARQVVTYRDLHERIGMIAYNCCKYNGRESDYGHVAREFEEAGDEMIRHAVLQLSPSSRRSTPVSGSVSGGGDGTTSSTTTKAGALANVSGSAAPATSETADGPVSGTSGVNNARASPLPERLLSAPSHASAPGIAPATEASSLPPPPQNPIVAAVSLPSAGNGDGASVGNVGATN
jgi:hypothetical protein